MNLLPLDAPEWSSLNGGYKIPYDASKALLRLAKGDDVWAELWENLHHQGDVGEASYAAVPHLIELAKSSPSRSWQLYALVSTIEIERHRKSNPPLPGWLQPSYTEAWSAIGSLSSSDLPNAPDQTTIQAILSAQALSKGSIKLGALILYTDSSELDEIIEAQLGWSELYA